MAVYSTPSTRSDTRGVGYGSTDGAHGQEGKSVSGATIARYRRVIPGFGITLGLSGNKTEARALLKRLHDISARGYVPPTSFAWIHLGLGEIDSAFEWLNRAVDECDQYMMPIKSYRFFDPIRADPRFQALLRKMNLEP